MRRWMRRLGWTRTERELEEVPEIDVDKEMQELQESGFDRVQAEKQLRDRMIGQLDGAIETMGETEGELRETADELERARKALEQRKTYLSRERERLGRRRRDTH